MASADAIPGAPARPAAGVLVVTIDRLPAWILPAYGATWVATPELDRLAARGLVLDRVIATTTDPVATLAALAAGGDLVGVAGALADGVTVVTDDAAALPSVLAAARGVEVPLPPRVGIADEPGDTCLGRLMAAAGEALAAVRRGCVWCHATSLGRVWDAPEGFRDAFVDPDDPPPPSGAAVPAFAVTKATDPDALVGVRQVFAGQVLLLDHCLAPLVAAVPADWAILVCGIRGLALGLHGTVGPGAAELPHGDIVHLPAILVEPSATHACQRERALAIPHDLGATLAALVGGRSCHPAQPWLGHDLAPWLSGSGAPPRDRVVVRGTGGAALVTDAWHLIAPAGAPSAGAAPAPRLYAKPDDYFEVSDVADRSPAVADELRALLAAAAAVGAAGQDAQAWSTALSAAAREPAA